MAGPLSGINSQQTPLFSAGINNQNANTVRTPEQKPQENRVQLQNTAAAESQRSNSENTARNRTDETSSFRSELSDSTNQRRGALVDITV